MHIHLPEKDPQSGAGGLLEGGRAKKDCSMALTPAAPKPMAVGQAESVFQAMVMPPSK